MAKKSAEPEKPAKTRIGTALGVEDDPILALSIEDTLRDAGAEEVKVCASTKQALAALEQATPDVLVLDVHLVDRDDGWAVAELVTQLHTKPPRIIFSTGSPEAIPEGIADMGVVLAKPYRPEALIEAIRGKQTKGFFAKLKGAISSD